MVINTDKLYDYEAQELVCILSVKDPKTKEVLHYSISKNYIYSPVYNGHHYDWVVLDRVREEHKRAGEYVKKKYYES